MSAAEIIATDATPKAETVNTPKQAAFILPTNLIHKIPGHNPRKVRSAKKTDEMRESIQWNGVLQPILVRPHPKLDKQFQLVAGETRYDLSVDCGYIKIPALIRHISDEDLLAMATQENVMRNQMTPMDEGEAAKSLLIKHDSNKDLVCKELGWSRTKLDGRIQLTHCITEVAQALCDESINISHAEILSGLRESSQKSALGLVLKKGLSAEELRQRIDAASLQLALAVFDTSDCAACPHNSSTQATLFDASTSTGKCLNKQCFEQKTEQHLQTTKETLAETYHRVELSRDVASGTTAIIATSGPNGLGEAQFSACTTCEHFGAIINSQVGNRAQITKNVCFNVSCHTKKVADYQSMIGVDTKPADQANTSGVTSASPKAAKTNKTATKAEPKKAATPAAIITKHHNIHRAAAAKSIATVERDCLIISLISLMADSQQKPANTPDEWPSYLSGKNRAKAASLLDKMETEELKAMQQELVALALHKSHKGDGQHGTDGFGSLAEWYSVSRKCDLSEHWMLDGEYLNHFTKPVIGQILEEAEFDIAHDKANGEKAFKKLINGKKGDIIKAVKASNFDFKGFIPAAMKLNKETFE